MMPHDTDNWFSDRKLEEIRHERRVELFDHFVDMVLDSAAAISLDTAVEAYSETLAWEGIPISRQ